MAAASAPWRVSYYELLGVTQDAELDLIKRSFRQLALRHHPDKLSHRRHLEAAADRSDGPFFAHESSDSHEENSLINFDQIKEAYECLRDVGRRREYDEQEYLNAIGRKRGKCHAVIDPDECTLQRANVSCEPCEEFVLVYRCQCGYDIDTSTAPTASSLVGESQGFLEDVLIACPGCSLVYDTSRLWEHEELEGESHSDCNP
jgi:DnaJ domain